MGAIDISGVWRSTARPEDVWTVISDLETWPTWWPAIRAVAPLNGSMVPTGDVAPAAQVTFDTPSPLRPLQVTLEVTERVAPERLVVRATEGPLAGRGEMRVCEEFGGSAASFDLHLRVRSRLFRPIGRVLAGAAQGGGSERMRRAGDDLARLSGGEPREHDV